MNRIMKRYQWRRREGGVVGIRGYLAFGPSNQNDSGGPYRSEFEVAWVGGRKELGEEKKVIGRSCNGGD